MGNDKTKATLEKIVIGLILLVIGLILFWSASEFYLYKVDSYAYYHKNLDTNSYTNSITIANEGLFNFGDVIFTITYKDCDLLFPTTAHIDSLDSQCTILPYTMGRNLNVECNILALKQVLEISWISYDEPQNCKLQIDYNPIKQWRDVPFPSLNNCLSNYYNLFQCPDFHEGAVITVPNPEYEKYAHIRGANIVSLVPIRDSFYRNGSVVLVSKIFADADYDLRITSEWYQNGAKIGREESDYNAITKIVENQLLSWFFWNTFSSGAGDTESIKAIVRYENQKIKDANSIEAQIIFENRPELVAYLNPDENIIWDNNIMSFFVNKLYQNNLLIPETPDYNRASFLLNLTREYIYSPPEAALRTQYDSTELDSLEAFKLKEGTNSEFNFVFVMANRAIGIPARIIEAQTAREYCSQVYLEESGWVTVDVFDKEQEFAEYSPNCKG